MNLVCNVDKPSLKAGRGIYTSDQFYDELGERGKGIKKKKIVH